MGFGALGLACLAARRDRRSRAAGRSARRRAVHTGPAPLRDVRVWSLAAGSALVVAPQICVAGFAVLFLHDRRGLDAGAAAAVLAVMQLCGIGGRIGAGRWSDVAGDRIAPAPGDRARERTLTFVTATARRRTALAARAVLIAAGVFAMSWNGLSFAAAIEIAGRARSGAAIGLQQTRAERLGAAYPPLFGVLVAATSWGWGFASIALFPLAGWHVLRALRA